MNRTIKIGNKEIGGKNPVFIIAELSANHRQDFKLAVKTIKRIRDCGADAIKLQTYTPETITIDSRKGCFRIKQKTLWDGRNLYQLYKEAYTPWEWQPELKKISEKLGLVFFSSPFDKTAVDFLERMEVPAYKVASFEITDIPLIEYIASKGKPVIISTGIARRQDIREAMDACLRQGNSRVVLLKCASAYPTPLEEVNLRMIQRLRDDFKCTVGVSDHSLGIFVPLAAVALGAKVIEKHIILDRKIGGPDAAFSLEPDEFKEMVDSVRQVEKSLGRETYELGVNASRSRAFCRSLFAVKDIGKGEILNGENVRSIRPGYGLLPKYLSSVLGKKARKKISLGTPLQWDLIGR